MDIVFGWFSVSNFCLSLWTIILGIEKIGVEIIGIQRPGQALKKNQKEKQINQMLQAMKTKEKAQGKDNTSPS